MAETLVEVGRFTFDTKTEVLTGPREYFESRGGVDAAVQKVLGSASFKIGLQFQPNPVVLMLVELQTDYAAFRGEKDLMARMDRNVVSLEDFGVAAS